MRTIPSRSVALALMGLIATVSVAACSTHPASSATDPAGLAATAPTATTTGPRTDSPSAATPSTSPGPVGVQNLTVTPSVLDELQAAYVAHMQFPPSDIAGTAPNSVHYAHDPATGTYWAMATFMASPTASFNTGVSMQDGGDTGMFTKASDGAWQMTRASFPVGCGLPQFFPAAVIAVWAVSTYCPPGH